MLPFNRNLKPFARKLRKNMTDAELTLWAKLRRKQLNGHTFYRQKNIGNYIVDFYCPGAKLVVELDGGQHAKDKDYDERRDEFLQREGYRVLRFWNDEMLTNKDYVLQTVLRELRLRCPSP